MENSNKVPLSVGPMLLYPQKVTEEYNIQPFPWLKKIKKSVTYTRYVERKPQFFVDKDFIMAFSNYMNALIENHTQIMYSADTEVTMSTGTLNAHNARYEIFITFLKLTDTSALYDIDSNG